MVLHIVSKTLIYSLSIREIYKLDACYMKMVLTLLRDGLPVKPREVVYFISTKPTTIGTGRFVVLVDGVMRQFSSFRLVILAKAGIHSSTVPNETHQQTQA